MPGEGNTEEMINRRGLASQKEMSSVFDLCILKGIKRDYTWTLSDNNSCKILFYWRNRQNLSE